MNRIPSEQIEQIKRRFEIVGQSEALHRALETAIKAAPTDITVLLSGESGVGKESFSKVIHHLSPRKHGPFLAVNCGAIPPGTIDSELFGHEKGAFTGAVERRKGYFEIADGGTLFLDEVGELPPDTQTRLLRVLETGEFIRVGGNKPIKTNVRVVSATNKDLRRLMQEGKFRDDLYYRLSIITIRIPPLRERKEDIPLLFDKFALDVAERYRVPPLELTPSGLEVFQRYPWPGNIRELKNVVEQISILEETRQVTDTVAMKYLDFEAAAPSEGGLQLAGAPVMEERELIFRYLEEIRKDVLLIKMLLLEGHPVSGVDHPPVHGAASEFRIPFRRALPPAQPVEVPAEKAAEPAEQSPGRRWDDFDGEIPSIEEMERRLIEAALKKYGGRRKKVAEALGIAERTLYRKIKTYNLEHL